MKIRISACVDEKTYFEIFEALRKKRFRNKSQLVETAVRRMLKQ